MDFKIQVIVFCLNLYFVSGQLSAAKIAQVNKDLCQDPTLDAALRTADNSSYFFKGDVFWKIRCNRVDKGYPKLIKDVWKIDPPVNAAFTLRNSTSYIMKDTKVWGFYNTNPLPSFPIDYKVSWSQRLPNKIDAAIALYYDVSVYLIEGPNLHKYTFEPATNQREGYNFYGVNSTFRTFQKLKAVPQAAMRYKRDRIFFVGKYCQKLEGRSRVATPPVPTALEWLQCRNNKPLYIDEVCCKLMRFATNGKKPKNTGPDLCPDIVKEFKNQSLK